MVIGVATGIRLDGDVLGQGHPRGEIRLAGREQPARDQARSIATGAGRMKRLATSAREILARTWRGRGRWCRSRRP